MRNIKIYQRGNQQYLNYIDQYGSRIRKSFKSLSELEKLAVLKIKEVNETPSVPFAKAVDEYFMSTYQKADVWKNGYPSNTRNNQTACLRYLKRLHKIANPRSISDINYQSLIHFFNHIRSKETTNGRTMSNNTANRYLSTFKSFFTFCVNMEYVKTNYAKQINNFKKESIEPHSFSEEEYQLILNNSGKYRYFFEFMYETGLRPSDTYNLTRNDFKFTESKIFLNIKMGKTSKKLNVPISTRAAEIVLNSSFKLFPMFSEGRSSWSWERKEVRKTLRRCFGANNSAGAKYVNKRHIKLHTFRHTFAMRHIANGTPLEAIKQLLGHSSIAMCEKYARSMPKENLTAYLQ